MINQTIPLIVDDVIYEWPLITLTTTNDHNKPGTKRGGMAAEILYFGHSEHWCPALPASYGSIIGIKLF